jgi:hypothetical protein
VRPLTLEHTRQALTAGIQRFVDNPEAIAEAPIQADQTLGSTIPVAYEVALGRGVKE